MKKKIGTMLDEDLLFQAKQVALLQKQPLTQLLENALRMYLLALEKKTKFKQNNISQSTRGAMSIPISTLKIFRTPNRTSRQRLFIPSPARLYSKS